MHIEISAQLNDFAKQRIADAKYASDYEKLKMSVIHTEIMLGQAELQYDSNDEDYKGYLEALDAIWGDVCSIAVNKADFLPNADFDFSQNIHAAAEEAKRALYDNYLSAAIAAIYAAKTNKSIRKLPLLSAAAFNKHKYEGYQGEIACLRMLLWAGFDPNAQDSYGKTALHFMAALKIHPGSHPRAVRLLLQAGANPNLKNDNGDTALCFLAGNTVWTAAHTKSAWILLQNGADPFAKARDGESAYSLWKKTEKDIPDVAEIVAIIEKTPKPTQTAAGDGYEAYYKHVGGKICNLLIAGDAREVLTFFGYMMAINFAKKLGKDDAFAKKMAPQVAEGLDAEYLIDTLAPYIEDGDTIAVGELAHAYLTEAAEARFESFKASMQGG